MSREGWYCLSFQLSSPLWGEDWGEESEWLRIVRNAEFVRSAAVIDSLACDGEYS